VKPSHLVLLGPYFGNGLTLGFTLHIHHSQGDEQVAQGGNMAEKSLNGAVIVW
jgi:hypothetical protein